MYTKKNCVEYCFAWDFCLLLGASTKTHTVQCVFVTIWNAANWNIFQIQYFLFLVFFYFVFVTFGSWYLKNMEKVNMKKHYVLLVNFYKMLFDTFKPSNNNNQLQQTTSVLTSTTTRRGERKRFNFLGFVIWLFIKYSWISMTISLLIFRYVLP